MRQCGLIALLTALTAGCQRTPEPSEELAAPKPQQVTLIQPQRQTVRRSIEQPGFNIEAFQQTPLFAKVAGYVRKVHVDIGDPVKGPKYDSAGKLEREGDLLVELWVPEMQVEVREKEALVRQAEAEVRQAKQALAAAAANVTSAIAKVGQAEASRLRVQAEHARAQSQYERLARVGKNGAIDKENVDEVCFGFDAAKAALTEVEAAVQSAKALRAESEAKRDKAESDVSVYDARLQVMQAQRDHAKTLLDYTRIRAPFDGRVTRRNVNDGDFVQPAASGSKGEPLVNVDDASKVRVFVNVPGADAVWVRDGTAALVRVPDLQGQTFPGQVTRTSFALNPRTRTLRTEIDLRNTDGRLRPGMYVSAAIVAERRDVWTLPSSAVLTQGEQTFCYVVQENKAVRVPIQIGLRGGALVEVVKQQTPSGVWQDFSGSETFVRDAAKRTDGRALRVGKGG